MSLLDDSATILKRADEAIKKRMIREKVAHCLVAYGLPPRCFVAEEQEDVLAKKISEVWNLSNIKWRTPFAENWSEILSLTTTSIRSELFCHLIVAH